MKVALYVRISSKNGKQDIDNQRVQLRHFCEAQAWEIVAEYDDHESGARSDRSGFRQMLHDASARKWDLLLFWALDRLTREGTVPTLTYLQLLESYGVRWRSFTEAWIDSAGPFRDVIISLLASLAKQERLRISERVRAGLERARNEGKQLGRRRNVFDRAKAARLRAEGWSWSKVARQLRVTVSAARRACREQSADLRRYRADGENRPEARLPEAAAPPSALPEV